MKIRIKAGKAIVLEGAPWELENALEKKSRTFQVIADALGWCTDPEGPVLAGISAPHVSDVRIDAHTVDRTFSPEPDLNIEAWLADFGVAVAQAIRLGHHGIYWGDRAALRKHETEVSSLLTEVVAEVERALSQAAEAAAHDSGKLEKACGFVAHTAGYSPCTRAVGHTGPCAHAYDALRGALAGVVAQSDAVARHRAGLSEEERGEYERLDAEGTQRVIKAGHMREAVEAVREVFPKARDQAVIDRRARKAYLSYMQALHPGPCIPWHELQHLEKESWRAVEAVFDGFEAYDKEEPRGGAGLPVRGLPPRPRPQWPAFARLTISV